VRHLLLVRTIKRAHASAQMLVNGRRPSNVGVGRTITKEVGASGQISLGKRLAGQLFDVVFHADGRVEMLPVRAVALVRDQVRVEGAIDFMLRGH
jgi:hypothetical protein